MNIYKEYIPYTYLIGWTKHQKFYYGRRTAKNCHPEEFWIKYFTSSDYVEQFRIKNGEPDIIQIHKTFPDNPTACRVWESKVLERLDAQNHPDFLNERNGDQNWDTTGKVPWNKGKNFFDNNSIKEYHRSKTFLIISPNEQFLVTGALTKFCKYYRFNPKTLKQNKIEGWSIEEIEYPKNLIKYCFMIFNGSEWIEFNPVFQPKRKPDFGVSTKGIHAAKNTIPCINKEGICKRIPKEEYYSQ